MELEERRLFSRGGKWEMVVGVFRTEEEEETPNNPVMSHPRERY